jgi:hypothetical protein
MAVINVNAFKYVVITICHRAVVQAKTDKLGLDTMTTSGRS